MIKNLKLRENRIVQIILWPLEKLFLIIVGYPLALIFLLYLKITKQTAEEFFKKIMKEEYNETK